jgi:hypothetical protein
LGFGVYCDVAARGRVQEHLFRAYDLGMRVEG